MGFGVIAAWAILAWRLLEDNEELLRLGGRSWRPSF